VCEQFIPTCHTLLSTTDSRQIPAAPFYFNVTLSPNGSGTVCGPKPLRTQDTHQSPTPWKLQQKSVKLIQPSITRRTIPPLGQVQLLSGLVDEEILLLQWISSAGRFHLTYLQLLWMKTIRVLHTLAAPTPQCAGNAVVSAEEFVSSYRVAQESTSSSPSG